MPLPRFRLRTLMIAVAVVAILLAGELARRRRALCLYRLENLALVEEMCRVYPMPEGGVDSLRPLQDAGIILWLPGDGKPMSRAEVLVEVARQRRRYERVVRYPWLPVPPDPSRPD